MKLLWEITQVVIALPFLLLLALACAGYILRGFRWK